MEKQHGVALFQRTTRRVALTEAGQALFLRINPAVSEIIDAYATLSGYRERPMGTLRISSPRNLRSSFLGPLMARFRESYPDVVLEVSLDDGLIDLIGQRYDAGIRLIESVEKDMVAVRLTPPITWSIVGSPHYFAKHGYPRAPEDLIEHEAIRYRFVTSRAIHRWAFVRRKRTFVVDVSGGVIVDDRQLLVDMARRGLGVAYAADHEVRQELAEGSLVAVLQSFIAADSGAFLYYPRQYQPSKKLRAFIDVAKEVAAQPDVLMCFEKGEAPLPPIRRRAAVQV